MRQRLDPTTLAESLGDVARSAATAVSPLFRYGTFSGKEEDVVYADDYVLVKYTYSDNGEDREAWARLFAAGGFWEIPDVVTEVRVLGPPVSESNAYGSTTLEFGTQRPNGKTNQLRQAVAFKVTSDSTSRVDRAKNHIFRAANGLTFGTSSNGAFQVTMPATGSGIRFDPATNTIELVISKMDTAGQTTPRAVIRLSEDGISIGASDGVPTKKVTWTMDSAKGSFTGAGSGAFSAAHPKGMLGVQATAASPVLNGMTGVSAIPSLSWFVSPT